MERKKGSAPAAMAAGATGNVRAGGEPYTPRLIAALLAAMPAETLRQVTPRRFQAWPARVLVPSATVQALIAQERATRGAA